MNTLEHANGAIVYDGPSRLDGSPIVVIVTGLRRPSANEKTGPMVQTWILRSDVHPVEAVHSGADAAICGQCPLRPLLVRARRVPGQRHGDPQCYVRKETGPSAIYRAYLEGAYPVAKPSQVRRIADKRKRAIRFGAYGDPGAAPLDLWRALLSKRRHTGYSHQWRRFPGLRRLVMASVDSLAEAREAWARGFRTFRITRDLSDIQPNEILCPASAEAGKRTTCENCGLCDGSSGASDPRKSIVIFDHGPTRARS